MYDSQTLLRNEYLLKVLLALNSLLIQSGYGANKISHDLTDNEMSGDQDFHIVSCISF